MIKQFFITSKTLLLQHNILWQKHIIFVFSFVTYHLLLLSLTTLICLVLYVCTKNIKICDLISNYNHFFSHMHCYQNNLSYLCAVKCVNCLHLINLKYYLLQMQNTQNINNKIEKNTTNYPLSTLPSLFWCTWISV